MIFRLTTYNFPGWKAYLGNQQVEIKDDNDFRLITTNIPIGRQTIKFTFENTAVRNTANFISLSAFVFTCWVLFKKLKKVDG